MAQEALINELIDTYRNLNLAIRGTPADPKTNLQDDPRVRELLRSKRDHELRLSKQLKERVTGVSFDDVVEEEELTLGTEQISNQAQVILSQFGTAREATLSLVRDLDEQRWNEVDEHGTSIRALVESIIDHDHQVLNQLREIVGLPIGRDGQLTASAVQAGAPTDRTPPR